MSPRTLTLLLTIALTGCGDSGLPLGKVAGRITLDGKPAANVVVTFIPSSGSGSPSYGATDDDGRYSLMFTDTKSGAMVGEHVIELETQKVSAGEAKDLKAQGLAVPVPGPAIPRKYRKRGALTAVVADGSNTIDLELTTR